MNVSWKDALRFHEALFLLFLGLRLTWYIGWSWWWVFAPLWGMGLIAGVIALLEGEKKA